jgi:hypothetical protein
MSLSAKYCACTFEVTQPSASRSPAAPAILLTPEAATPATVLTSAAACRVWRSASARVHAMAENTTSARAPGRS